MAAEEFFGFPDSRSYPDYPTIVSSGAQMQLGQSSQNMLYNSEHGGYGDLHLSGGPHLFDGPAFDFGLEQPGGPEDLSYDLIDPRLSQPGNPHGLADALTPSRWGFDYFGPFEANARAGQLTPSIPPQPLHVSAPKNIKRGFGGREKPSKNKVDNSNRIVKKSNAKNAKNAASFQTTLQKKIKKAKGVIRKQAGKMGTNVKIAHTSTGITMTGAYWPPLANDHTIPSTNAEIKACTDTLVDAICNNRDCKEGENTSTFRNRWGPTATYYTRNEFKAVARDVTMAMIDIHHNGWTKPIYDKDMRALIQQTMFMSFKERFDGVHELLMYSKRTCADLLKGERLYSVIGNPFALIKRTAVNQQANVNKGRTLREAKEITKRAREEEEEEKEEDEQEEENEDDDEDEDDDSSAPIAEAARPRKRAKGAHST